MKEVLARFDMTSITKNLYNFSIIIANIFYWPNISIARTLHGQAEYQTIRADIEVFYSGDTAEVSPGE